MERKCSVGAIFIGRIANYRESVFVNIIWIITEEGVVMLSMSNTLQSVHTKLISEWSDKNLPLTPDKITFGSNKKVWWKGACRLLCKNEYGSR